MSVVRRLVLPAVVAVATALPFALADALSTTAAEPAIAAAVASILETQHYAHAPIDDARSRQWFDAYLERLDYDRMYFLKSDVDGFTAAYRDRLDDEIHGRPPRTDAAYAMHAKLLQRMEERAAFVTKLLEQGTFTFDDPNRRVDLDRHDDPWATTTAELDRVWRDRIAEQILRARLAALVPDPDVADAAEAATGPDGPRMRTPGFEPADPNDQTLAADREAETRSRLLRRYQRILADQQSLDASDVLEAYLAALTSTYDPHSVWFKPVSKENFDIELRDALTGIGAVLRNEDGYTVIQELITGGPAEQSGQLSAKDKILAVAQGDGDPVDVVEMRLDKVVQLIRGPVDTEVVLTIHPADAADPAQTVPVRLVRDRVKLARAAASAKVRQVDGVKVGVIDVPSFYVDSEGRREGQPDWASTARDIRALLDQFTADGVEAVVLDLRRNGGGSLDQAIETTGLFLDTGPVVQIRNGDGRVEVLADEDRGAAWTGPLAVLISEGSASASEILAGAIQDHGRGLILGAETSHGKGTVQNLFALETFLRRTGHAEIADRGGALKFTTHMFFRPNGASTQVKGVASDIVIPSPYQGLKIKEEDLEGPLPWAKIPAARFTPQRMGADVDALRAASAVRVRASMEFAFLEEDLMERERLQADTTVSLYEPARAAELQKRNLKLSARRLAREAERPENKAKARGAGEAPTARANASTDDAEDDIPDAILDEALSITRDLVRQLRA